LDDQARYALSFLEGNSLIARVAAAVGFGALALRSRRLRTADCRGDLAAAKADIPEHPVIKLQELLFGLAVCPLDDALGQNLPHTRDDVSHETNARSVRDKESRAFTPPLLGLGAYGHI
jgi:hypothetical protein